MKTTKKFETEGEILPINQYFRPTYFSEQVFSYGHEKLLAADEMTD